MEQCCCPVLCLSQLSISITLIDRGLLMNLKHLIVNCQDVQEPLSKAPIFCVFSVSRWIQIGVTFTKLAREK